MRNEQGFSLIELLIVVAIIAVIAAIAVPSLLQAKMAANEAGAIQGCRTVGSAQVAYAAVNNQTYAALSVLVDANNKFLDTRYDPTGLGFNGYQYADADITLDDGTTVAAAAAAGGSTSFSVTSTPQTADSTGRYIYGITTDQIVRYVGTAGNAAAPSCGTNPCAGGEPIGTNK